MNIESWRDKPMGGWMDSLKAYSLYHSTEDPGFGFGVYSSRKILTIL